jgi:dTDP-4-amino-4,6-dideoxygalactose transaminase
MEGIQGAVLGVKLKHLAKWTAERRRVAHRYHELLADTPLQLPREAAWGESARSHDASSVAGWRFVVKPVPILRRRG